MADSDLYNALIGAPVDSAEKQRVLADMLRRKAGFATVAQLTGDPTLAPMGEQQAQQAAQQAQQLQRGQQNAQQMAFDREKEARQAAAQQEQLALERSGQALIKRGQDLNFSADLARLEAAADKAGNKASTEGERKDASLAVRLEGALRELGSLPAEAQAPSVLEKALSFSDTAANTVRSPDRQRANAAQLDALDAALTLGTGASYNREQLEGMRTSYFPQIGDSKEAIKAKNDRFQAVVNSARLRAGRAAPSIDQALGPSKKVVRTGTSNGKKVVQYDDGSVEYAD